MVWAMRIFWCVTIGMMHSMQDRIGSRRKVRTTLPHPGEKVEEPFPEFSHDKHLMCCVSVQEEALAKQGKIPVQ